MSTSFSWEGIKQVRATLLGAQHVPEHLCGGYVHLGRCIMCSAFTFFWECGMGSGLSLVVFLQSLTQF